MVAEFKTSPPAVNACQLDRELLCSAPNMGTGMRRVVGFLFASFFAALLFYFGNALVRRSLSSREGTPATRPTGATALPQPAEDKRHEAGMLAAALKRKPHHVPVLLRLAQLSSESGNSVQAAAHLKEILQYEPDNADARLELGKALFESGDVRGAIEHTSKILERNPAHPDALYNLGAIYANIGNHTRARECWMRLISSNPQAESSVRASRMLTQLSKDSF